MRTLMKVLVILCLILSTLYCFINIVVAIYLIVMGVINLICVESSEIKDKIDKMDKYREGK